MSDLQKAQFNAFKWRVWNVVKTPLIAVVVGVVVKILADVVEGDTVMVILSWGYWDSVLVEVAKIVGGILAVGIGAGADKVYRFSNDVETNI